MSHLDVIVVGAGPAGSAAAAVLAERGYHTALVDRATFPRDKPCGDYCDPGAVRLLDRLGMLPDLTREGAAFITGMTVVAQDGSAFAASFPTGRGMLLPRRRLDAALARRAARCGATFREGWQVDWVRVETERYVSIGTVDRRHELRARMLIAADGMRSVIARRLHLRTSLPEGRYTAGAYFSGVPGTAGGELHLGPGLYGGVARFGDGTANVCLALPRERFRGRTLEAVFADAARTLPRLRDDLRSWKRETTFRVTGPVGFAAHPVLTARTLLAGDAAQQVEPITGQGIYFALRSGLLAAEEAGAALAGDECGIDALRGYARRRRRLLGPKLRLLRIVTGLAVRPGVAPGLVRRLQRDRRAAQMLLGATGDVLPPECVASLRYVIRLLGLRRAHDA